SNAATTSRPSTGSNPKKSGRHSVGIGALRGSTKNCCSTTVFVDSQPRCTQQCEKSALAHRQLSRQSGQKLAAACRRQNGCIERWSSSSGAQAVCPLLSV